MEESKLRKIADINLDEAIEVLKLFNGFKNKDYKIRIEKDTPYKGYMARLYHIDPLQTTDLIFDDHAGIIPGTELGRPRYVNYYQAIKYLEKKGFDLEDIVR
jgi:hypothetical protein